MCSIDWVSRNSGPIFRRSSDEKYDWLGFGENIAFQIDKKNPRKSAAAAVAGWLTSDGHRRNMLDAQYTETGVGAARSKSGKWYYCQLFATPAGKQ